MHSFLALPRRLPSPQWTPVAKQPRYICLTRVLPQCSSFASFRYVLTALDTGYTVVDRASKIVKGILSRRGAVEPGSRAGRDDERGRTEHGLGADHRGGGPVRGAVAGAPIPAACADAGGGARQHGHQRHRHSRPRRHLLLPPHHLRSRHPHPRLRRLATPTVSVLLACLFCVVALSNFFGSTRGRSTVSKIS
jgi:hypothetical protein